MKTLDDVEMARARAQLQQVENALFRRIEERRMAKAAAEKAALVIELAAMREAEEAAVVAEALRLQAENDALEAENAARREAEAQGNRPSHSRKTP